MQEVPIVLIGHKDHGKSTLIGRLLLETKSIKESRLKEIQEVDQAWGRKFELAHLVDSFQEERDREMTMDTTRVLLKGKERNYQLIDVPGHQELISQMLTGASGAEAALLLVDITEGIKEQTCQHLEIAKLLGIEQLGVVVNKMDKVNYQEKPFIEIKKKLKEILNNIGYSSKNIHFFPISAWEGDNVIKKSEKTAWYPGPTVMEFLEKEIRKQQSLENLPLSFLVQDKYSEGNSEILVGRVEGGTLRVGQEDFLLPDKIKIKIESIRDSEGELKEAKAGQNVGIKISGEGLIMSNLFRGAVIVSPDSNLKIGNVLSGEMFWIERPSLRVINLECGTAQVMGTLFEPETINPAEKTPYKIFLSKPIVFDPKGKTILGKIVLKDRGNIISVGNIL